MKPIIYVMHPVSGDAKANAERAIRWVRWFVLNDPNRIYIAPWVAEVLGFVGEEAAIITPKFYQRVLDDDCDVIRRGIDGAVGVGGKWSTGMLQERATVRALSRPLLDMTRFIEPTDVPSSFNFEISWEHGEPRDSQGHGIWQN